MGNIKRDYKIIPFSRDLVTIGELAKRCRVDRSPLRKWALDRGFVFALARTEDTRSQLTMVMTKAQAQAFLEERERQGFRVKHLSKTKKTLSPQ
jgi:hypothetical protein